jgi:methionyl-tRNA formyltransferase
MKIIFMGTPQFAVVCLKKLYDNGINIISVVTAPDKPVGRGLKLVPSPVKTVAQTLELPVLQPENLKDLSFLTKIESLQPDLLIIVAFRILPEVLFSKAKLGAVNLHGSLLPKYRGAAPINWAIINGETETGITTFFLKQKVDTGNIIAQKKINIPLSMTAGELHDIMAKKGADLLLETIDQIESDKVKTIPQIESEVSKAPKIFSKDCLITFNQPVKKVHDFIRGLSPKPGAYTFYKGKRLHFFNSQIADTKMIKGEIGSHIDTNESDSISIQCNPGLLLIKEIKLEGKRRMPVKDFLRGHVFEPGTIFGESG